MIDAIQNVLIFLLFIMVLYRRPHFEVRKISKEEFKKLLEEQDETH